MQCNTPMWDNTVPPRWYCTSVPMWDGTLPAIRWCGGVVYHTTVRWHCTSEMILYHTCDIPLYLWNGSVPARWWFTYEIVLYQCIWEMMVVWCSNELEAGATHPHPLPPALMRRGRTNIYFKTKNIRLLNILVDCCTLSSKQKAITIHCMRPTYVSNSDKEEEGEEMCGGRKSYM